MFSPGKHFFPGHHIFWAYCLLGLGVFEANCLGAYCLWSTLSPGRIVSGHFASGRIVSGHHALDQVKGSALVNLNIYCWRWSYYSLLPSSAKAPAQPQLRVSLILHFSSSISWLCHYTRASQQPASAS